MSDRAQRTGEIAAERWGGVPLRERLKVIRGARHRIAEMSAAFAAAISPELARTPADTLVTELLPLLDACRFLEREAETILAPRNLYGSGRSWWLRSVDAQVCRVPLGRVAIIGPSNFPLLIPGVQVMQGIAAGNGVTWKPGAGGRRVADLVAGALKDAGLPLGVLLIADDSVNAAQRVLAALPDKVVFTGAAANGRAVMRTLAETGTPSVMELSGCDAVIVLPGADLERVAKAVAFGLRLNGGAVCMSPRRLLALGDTITALRPLLERELATVPAVKLNQSSAALLTELIEEAKLLGAVLHGEVNANAQRPIVVDGARPGMRVAHTDIFAPVISVMTSSQIAKMPDTVRECGYSLTVAIFGKEREARELATQVRAGTVLINDIIVPTADARVPFGGVGDSGFGVTRGAEGLLEMTAVKTVLVRRGKEMRHYAAATTDHLPFFDAMIRASHARGWKARLAGWRDLIQTGQRIKE